jgi:hypothetical protein
MSLPSARSIAFNRRLSPAWLKEGLRLRAEGVTGSAWVEAMRVVVSAEVSGLESIQKSLRYLRHALLEPGEIETLREEAILLFQTSRDPERVRILSWGLAAAAYPFLQEVAGIIGRMLRIQPEMKLEQFQRRLAESFGEKETVRRSGRYSVGLIHDLGFLRRTKNAGHYAASPATRVEDADLASWLIKVWFFSTGIGGPVDRVSLSNHPGLSFFDAAGLVAAALKTGTLSVDRMSMSQDTVSLMPAK